MVKQGKRRDNTPLVKQKITKQSFRRVVIALLITAIAITTFVAVEARTTTAKQRLELEAKTRQLIDVRNELEQADAKTKKQKQAQEKKLKELETKLRETEKALQAKRSTKNAVAEAATTVTQPSGSCRDWMIQAGVPAAQMAAAYTLIMRESGCRVNAYNPSGAYGIPQSLPGSKMASVGSDWQTNPVTQIKWMIGYVNARYGGFPQALAHSYANNWY